MDEVVHMLSIFHASDDIVIDPIEIEKLFACMDADKGGTVSREELKSFIEATARASTRPPFFPSLCVMA